MTGLEMMKNFRTELILFVLVGICILLAGVVYSLGSNINYTLEGINLMVDMQYSYNYTWYLVAGLVSLIFAWQLFMYVKRNYKIVKFECVIEKNGRKILDTTEDYMILDDMIN